MEKWNHKSVREHQKRNNYRKNPSFSSTLLDTIYRSIDEGMKTEQKQSTRKQQKQSNNNMFRHFDDENDVVLQQTKPPNNNNKNIRRNSLTEFDRRRTRSGSSNSFPIFSTSSSSDSSYGFSSSESESVQFNNKTQKLKPIRTSVSSFSSSIPRKDSNFEALKKTQKANPEKNRTKSKPNSPGARLASFLNSLFNSSGNAKKAKVEKNNSHESKPPQQTTSYCSSASSLSRSCLSKTPSSRSGGGVKRSVRFCPVSVIVDEDCKPCGQKKILLEEDEEEEKKRNEELRFHVMKESLRVEEFARELLKKKKKEENGFHDMNYEDDDDDDDDDDGVSCASSDLFELDNLSGVGINGIERYREELPVYETTHFNTNRAIANGFIL